MPPKGHKQSAETIAKRLATRKANLRAKAAGHVLAPRAEVLNGKDAAVYLRHALQKWPVEKKRTGRARGIARLYVELALATLEGEA